MNPRSKAGRPSRYDGAVLGRAGQLRAEGVSWTEVGRALGKDPNGLRLALKRSRATKTPALPNVAQVSSDENVGDETVERPVPEGALLDPPDLPDVSTALTELTLALLEAHFDDETQRGRDIQALVAGMQHRLDGAEASAAVLRNDIGELSSVTSRLAEASMVRASEPHPVKPPAALVE